MNEMLKWFLSVCIGLLTMALIIIGLAVGSTYPEAGLVATMIIAIAFWIGVFSVIAKEIFFK